MDYEKFRLNIQNTLKERNGYFRNWYSEEVIRMANLYLASLPNDSIGERSEWEVIFEIFNVAKYWEEEFKRTKKSGFISSLLGIGR